MGFLQVDLRALMPWDVYGPEVGTHSLTLTGPDRPTSTMRAAFGRSWRGEKMTCRILVCGNNKDLLKTRAMVLATAPFEVEMVIGVQALLHQDFDVRTKLIVLCHSLSDREQNEVAQQAQLALPETPILTLNSPTRLSSPLSSATMDPLDGPRALIALSRKLAID